MVTYGNCIGRTPFFQIEATKHHTNLFAVMVGRSSRARKGTSLDHAKKIFSQADRYYLPQIVSGLSTGEGLIAALHDEITKEEWNKKTQELQRHLVSAAVTDKRLLVAETEFARTLKAMGRTGSTLTEVLRSAWDDGDLRIITRSHPIKATGTHVSFIGHITEEELEKELGECERFNGFANRFLWATAERNKLLPEGGNLDRRRLAELADALGKSIVRARKIGVMLRDEEARNHWDSAYRELGADHRGMLGATTERAEAQVLRISMILALSDGSPVITPTHQQAALAFWQYYFASARNLFGRKASDPRAQRILNELRRRPEGMTRTQISEEIFEHNLESPRIDTALQHLLELGLATFRKEATGGRNIERWFAT